MPPKKLFLKEIVEGKTRLLVPDLKHYKRMEDAPVFYNPRMQKNRDISILVAKEFFKNKRRKIELADILAGAGAHAIRYANECDFKVTVNDASPTAVNVAMGNAKLNKVKIKTVADEANRFLLKKRKNKFDCVDIDPFGSPMPFIVNALRALNPKGGLLCVTATDIGTLAGSFPIAAYRRYGIRTGKTSFKHELGVRNLLMSIYRETAKQDLTIKPLMSYAEIHYYRTFLEISPSKILSKDIGFLLYCPKCEFRKFVPLFKKYKKPKRKRRCSHKDLEVYGPTWIGKIHDKKFLGKLKKHSKIIHRCWEEASVVEPYYNIHILTKKYKVKGELPKMDALIKRLRKYRYKASRSAFSNHGIKTNAPLS